MSRVAYLSGPMTGYPNDNRAAFQLATTKLRWMGFEVISPDELDRIDPAHGHDWAALLRRDIPHVCRADVCVVLPGWRASRGAVLEVLIASQLGMQVMEYPLMRHLDPNTLPVPTTASLSAPN